MIEGLLIGAVIAYGYQSYLEYEDKFGWTTRERIEFALYADSTVYAFIALAGLIGSAIS